jgi:hypothetical protein
MSGKWFRYIDLAITLGKSVYKKFKSQRQEEKAKKARRLSRRMAADERLTEQDGENKD